MFKRNMGVLDRVARVFVATVLLPTGLFLLGGARGSALGLVVAGFSLLPLLTGLTGFCPIYVPFKFSTLNLERNMMRRCMSMAQHCAPGGLPGSGRGCGSRMRHARTDGETRVQGAA